jgi:hypothetical protein
MLLRKHVIDASEEARELHERLGRLRTRRIGRRVGPGVVPLPSGVWVRPEL